MKKLILSFSFIFICSIQGKAQQHAQYGFYDKYYLGVLDNGRQHTYSYFSGMNLNLWMHYGMQVTQMFPEGFERGWYDWDIHDLESANISEYEHTVRDVVMYTNGTLGYRTVAERPKISRLCFAQRSDYYCNQNHIDPYYDFYAFSEHDGRDEDFQDAQYNNNKWVRHCLISESTNPHMVVTGLLANREQVNITGPCSAWQIDGFHTFYIKPKIRIPQSFVTPEHLETPVCRIQVYSWDGITIIKDVIIKAGYFRVNTNNTYNGEYIEEYNFSQDPGTDLKINPTPNSNGDNPFNPGPTPHAITDEVCNVDYTVQWLGQCDMWLDYIRVDDETANDLLDERPGNLTHQKYMNWINWEVNNIAAQSGYNPLKFYIEEFFFESIPCIKYVNQKIREYSDNKYSLMCDMNTGEYYNCHRRYLWQAPEMTADYVKHTLIDGANLDEIYTFAYPFDGYYENSNIPNWRPNESFSEEVYVPETLPLHDYDPLQGRYSKPKPPSVYDTWLQGYLERDDQYHFNNKLIGIYKLADNLSKMCNKPFVNILQTHLWYSRGTPNSLPYVQREPTNEEMEMMANVGVTYGAKGQFWFWWGSDGEFGTNFCARGLSETDHLTPRYDNVYGQWQNGAGTSKIGTVGEINGTFNKWGPYLMSFDNANRHSYIYRLQNERNDLLANSYFADVVTYKPGTVNPTCSQQEDDPGEYPPGLVYECNENRYLQVARFKKSDDDGNQYFMITNRRCSPLWIQQVRITGAEKETSV